MTYESNLVESVNAQLQLSSSYLLPKLIVVVVIMPILKMTYESDLVESEKGYWQPPTHPYLTPGMGHPIPCQAHPFSLR